MGTESYYLLSVACFLFRTKCIDFLTSELRMGSHCFTVDVFNAGPPGVGKAELGKSLSDATGRTHLSVGHLLREEAKQATERARLINEAILMGVLVASVCE